MARVAIKGVELEVAELIQSECRTCNAQMDWKASDVNPAAYTAECCGVKYTAVPMLYQITNEERVH